MYHRFVRKKKLGDWKSQWKTVVRDLKPFWVYQMSAKMLRYQGIFKEDSPKSFESLKALKNGSISEFGRRETEEEQSGWGKEARTKTVEKELDPIIKHNFEEEIRATSRGDKTRWGSGASSTGKSASLF